MTSFPRPGRGRSRRIGHALLSGALMVIWPLTPLLPFLGTLLSWLAGVR